MKFILKPFYIKLLSITLISCLGTIAYSNTFHCSFQLDDISYIVDNPFIRDVWDLHNIWAYLPRHFILNFSFALNYHFHQLNVFGYHLFNLAVHLVTAILVWWLTLLTLSTTAMKENKIARHADLVALFTGLVFVSHPIQTEAVTYIVQRAASLATLFYLASLCFYVKSRLLQDAQSSFRLSEFYYIGSILIAVAAMFTKEIAITLPLMILLYEFSFLKTGKDFNWDGIAPFLLTLLFIPLTMLFTETGAERWQQLQSEPGISSTHYFMTQFRVMVTYIRLVFFPFNQNLDYDYPVYKNIFELPVWSSFIFLTIILFFAKHMFSRCRIISFSILWFFLTLLPESSFMPIKDVIFEHRLYLPMVGYSMFLVSGLCCLLGKDTVKAVVVVLTVIVAFNAVLTYQRNKVWKDEFTLWDDTAKKSPGKARPNTYLGLIYYRQGNITQALLEYNRAIKADPEYWLAYNNRAVTYDIQGNFVQAISDYSRAIEIKPSVADFYYSRGITYTKQKDFNRALSDYSKAIELNPNYLDAYFNRALLYDQQGKSTEAIADYSKIIEIDPKVAVVYFNRGGIYTKLARFTQAIPDLNKAIEIYPGYAAAYTILGRIYSSQGDLIKAMSYCNKAIEIDPKNAGACPKTGSPL